MKKLTVFRNPAEDKRITYGINLVMEELERQGYIYTVKGKGNFVSDNGQLLLRFKEELFAELKKICKEAFEVGITEEEIIQNIRGGEKDD